MSYKELETKEGWKKPENADSAENQQQIHESEDTPVRVVPNSDNEMEVMNYVGYDSTGRTELAILHSDIPEEDIADLASWQKQFKKKGSKIDPDKALTEGVELAQRFSRAANLIINEAAKNFAERAISIGEICLRLKELVRKKDELWGDWAEKNLPFIGKRNREKFMLLANRKNRCLPYTHLGVDRLEMLCSVTKKSEAEDPIGALLQKYEIPCAEDAEVDMATFRNMVDAAISNERLLKNGISVDFSLVFQLIKLGFEFDRGLVNRIKEVQGCGGDPETFLKNRSLGSSEDPEENGEKRVQDFNTLSTRLIKTLDYLLKEVEQIDKVDQQAFATLVAKLQALQEAWPNED